MSEEQEMPQKRTWRDAFKRAPESTPAAGRRRRWLVRLGIAAVAVVILVIVPGYIALQPSFVQRYANLDPQYQTWSKSAHVGVACQGCHVSPQPVAQAFYGVKMLGEFYVSIVFRSRQPNLFPKPANAACQNCHVDLRTVSPSGDLNIPHQAHVTVLKMQCITCHKYLVHETSPVGKHAPTMAACLTCHNGKVAKNACSTCHTNKGIPESHKAANWDIIHPTMVGKINCPQCHAWTANWCAECHTRRPRSHGADWRTKHGQRVLAHRNCEVCHTAAFCIRCHGVVPPQGLNPALQLVK